MSTSAAAFRIEPPTRRESSPERVVFELKRAAADGASISTRCCVCCGLETDTPPRKVRLIPSGGAEAMARRLVWVVATVLLTALLYRGMSLLHAALEAGRAEPIVFVLEVVAIGFGAAWIAHRTVVGSVRLGLVQCRRCRWLARGARVAALGCAAIVCAAPVVVFVTSVYPAGPGISTAAAFSPWIAGWIAAILLRPVFVRLQEQPVIVRRIRRQTIRVDTKSVVFEVLREEHPELLCSVA